jgi:hypothetical protein
MTEQTVREPEMGLTFEKVWAMFQETDRKMQETDRKMQKTAGGGSRRDSPGRGKGFCREERFFRARTIGGHGEDQRPRRF